MKRNIAIVAGGDSSEHHISIRSAQTILANLDISLYEPFIVEIEGNRWEVVLKNGQKTPIDRNDFSFTIDNKKVIFDYAYIIIHGTPGENGIFAGYLKLLDIPFSTCDVLSSALTFNKFMLNQFLKSFGVRVADSILLRRGSTISVSNIEERFGLPCFIKPTAGGSSFGTTKVKTREEIEPAIESAFNESDEVIVEAFIKGMELTCGYFRTKERAVVLPITQVIPKTEFFDFDAKYRGMVEEITPAPISDNLKDRVQKLTAAIYDILGCRGIIRNDYIVSEDNKINLLEVNTTPGMTPTSFIPQQIIAAGMSVKEVLTEIIEDSFS